MEVTHSIPLSIKFILQSHENKKCKDKQYLFVRITYKRQRAYISLKMDVDIDEWDTANEQFKKGAEQYVKRNSKVMAARVGLTDIYEQLIKSNSPISAAAIKNQYTNQKNGVVSVNGEMKFTDYYAQHIEELKLKPNEYGEGVIAHYLKTQTHLHRFLKLQGWQNYKMSDLSRKFLERFEHYLLTTPNKQTGRPMNGNTATTYLRKIKASVNSAIRSEVLDRNPFIGYRLKPFKGVNKVFLTKEELVELKKHDLADNLSLQRVRDAFLFSCYTSLRYSDVSRIEPGMVKKDKNGLMWVSLKIKKTKEYLETPLQDEAVKIYDKYKPYHKETNRIVPVLSNQKTNAALKTIATLVGLNKKLSFHCARHTFATRTLEETGDIKTVSGLMGHSSIRSTEIYAKLTRNRKADVIKFLNQLNKKTKKGEKKRGKK